MATPLRMPTKMALSTPVIPQRAGMVFSDAVDAALTQGNNDRGTVIAEEALARDLKVTVFPLSCYVVGAPV